MRGGGGNKKMLISRGGGGNKQVLISRGGGGNKHCLFFFIQPQPEFSAQFSESNVLNDHKDDPV